MGLTKLGGWKVPGASPPCPHRPWTWQRPESVIWPSLSPRHVLALPAVPAAIVAPGTLGPESSGNLSCGQSRRTRVLGLWREAGPGGIWEMVLGPEWPTGGMAGPGIGDQLQGGRERMGNADRGRGRKAGRGGAGRKGGAYGRPEGGHGFRPTVALSLVGCTSRPDLEMRKLRPRR